MLESNAANRKRPSHHYATQRIVMRRAWKAARKAQPLFGGTVRQYLAEALRQEWAELLSDPLYQESQRMIRDARAYRQSPAAYAVSSRRAARCGAGAWIGQ